LASIVAIAVAAWTAACAWRNRDASQLKHGGKGWSATASA